MKSVLNFKVILAIAAFFSFLIILTAGVWLAFIYPTNIIQGDGNLNTQNRELGDFKRIIVSDAIKVNLNQTRENRAIIKAESNIIPRVLTSIRGETLFIELETLNPFSLKLVEPKEDIIVDLSFKDISSIVLNDSASLISSNRLRISSLDLNLSGTSQLQLDVFTTQLKVILNNSSALNIRGSANIQNVEISGSAIYNAQDLESNEAVVTLTGSGDAVLRVSDSISASVNGTGNIGYYGIPDRVTQQARGGGKIAQLGE